MNKMKLEKIGGMCPEQYEGFDVNDKWVYIRYRYGILSIQVWDNKDFRGEEHFYADWKIGDTFDGTLKDSHRKILMKRIKDSMELGDYDFIDFHDVIGQ